MTLSLIVNVLDGVFAALRAVDEVPVVKVFRCADQHCFIASPATACAFNRLFHCYFSSVFIVLLSHVGAGGGSAQLLVMLNNLMAVITRHVAQSAALGFVVSICCPFPPRQAARCIF